MIMLQMSIVLFLDGMILQILLDKAQCKILHGAMCCKTWHIAARHSAKVQGGTCLTESALDMLDRPKPVS